MMTLLTMMTIVAIDRPKPRIADLIPAVAMVESGADPCTPDGKAGEVGIMQITDICLRDCNRIMGYKRWEPEDRRDVGQAFMMFEVYCRYYYPNGTHEQWARLWNAGPNKKRQYGKYGDLYWAKVNKVLDAQKATRCQN